LNTKSLEEFRGGYDIPSNLVKAVWMKGEEIAINFTLEGGYPDIIGLHTFDVTKFLTVTNPSKKVVS
jgi:hypothetical protein